MARPTLKSKITFDQYVGGFLAAFFDLMASGVGRLLRRSHKDVPFERLLIMKFKGMGSLACAYPAILCVKKRHPHAEIVFWGSKQTVALAKELNVFSSFIELQDESYLGALTSLIRNLISIWKYRPQWTFDLEVYSNLSSVLSLFTLSTNRVGFIKGSTRFRKHLYTHLHYFNTMQYLGDLYRSMLLEYGGREQEKGTETNLDFAEEMGIQAHGEENARPIIMNINSGELASERRWPIEKFRELIERMLDDYPYDIVLTGTTEEKGLIDALVGQLREPAGKRVRNAGGLLSLRDLLTLFKNCRLVITNDSGPLHLAVLMGTPIIALFGPTHPGHILPAGEKSIVPLYHNYLCSPCIHVMDALPCDGTAPCMQSIEVDEVYSAVRKVLDNPQRANDATCRMISGSKVYERER
jgi:ADP-heptose:LPS heptosyltransferase